jgi:ribosome modulation factor
MWDRVAQFVATHTVALQPAASPHFRGRLEFAFQEGYRQGSQPRGEAVETAFRSFCPVQKATVLRERIVRVAA